MNNKKTFLGVGAIILIVAVVVGYFISNNHELVRVDYSAEEIPVTEEIITEQPEKKYKYLADGHTVTELSDGWEIKNPQGNVLSVRQSQGVKMELSQVIKVKPDGVANDNYVNFEDIDLTFVGTDTVNVTVDNSREDTFSNKVDFDESFYGPTYYPVIISSSTVVKLPAITSDVRTPKFCVADESIPHDIHKKRYNTEMEYTFNVYSIAAPAYSKPESSCTHFLTLVRR